MAEDALRMNNIWAACVKIGLISTTILFDFMDADQYFSKPKTNVNHMNSELLLWLLYNTVIEPSTYIKEREMTLP